MSPHTIGDPSTAVITALAVVKTVLFLVGGVVTYFSFKAYRRTGRRALGALALGFALVTAGILSAGFLFEFLGRSLALGILVESLVVLAGFTVIAYSLYIQ